MRALLALALLSLDGAAAEGAKRILWLGSNSTVYHDLPGQAAGWLSRSTGERFLPDAVGRAEQLPYRYILPGFQAQYGLRSGETVAVRIVQGGYYALVLQVSTHALAGAGGEDGKAYADAIDTYCRWARDAGTRVILFEQGWGALKEDPPGQKMLRAAARKNGVAIAPCRSAWLRVRAEHPLLELHDLPDDVRPGALGTYLNLAVFYAALSGRTPAGLPEREVDYWPFVHRDGVLSRDRSGVCLTLRPALAGYLQRVAWESWVATERELGRDPR